MPASNFKEAERAALINIIIRVGSLRCRGPRTEFVDLQAAAKICRRVPCTSSLSITAISPFIVLPDPYRLRTRIAYCSCNLFAGEVLMVEGDCTFLGDRKPDSRLVPR